MSVSNVLVHSGEVLSEISVKSGISAVDEGKYVGNVRWPSSRGVRRSLTSRMN